MKLAYCTTLFVCQKNVKNFGIYELSEQVRDFLINEATREEVDEFLSRKYEITV